MTLTFDGTAYPTDDNFILSGTPQGNNVFVVGDTAVLAGDAFHADHAA